MGEAEERVAMKGTEEDRDDDDGTMDVRQLSMFEVELSGRKKKTTMEKT